MVVENNNLELSYYFLNSSRKDVVNFFIEKRKEKVKETCGFDCLLDITQVSKVGVCAGQSISWCYDFKIKKVLEVLRGKEDWLFLANDTNRSIDQFVGKVTLDESKLLGWRTWAKEFKTIQQNYNCCFLIANSKENVLPEYYPYEKGKITIAEQVEKILVEEGVEYISPLKSMQENKGTYYKTDTHWSDFGAYLAFKELISYFDLQHGFEDMFSFDATETVGDLGSKLSPVQKSSRLTVKLPRPLSSYCVYDNRLAGTGLIKIFENKKDCTFDKSIVIFGGSSVVTSMIKFFVPTFRKTILVNSPNTVIMEVLDSEKPDFVLLQTNERYLGTACSIKNKVADVEWASKLNEKKWLSTT